MTLFSPPPIPDESTQLDIDSRLAARLSDATLELRRTPSRTYVNAGMPNGYRPTWTTVRDGANDHQSIKSRGV